MLILYAYALLAMIPGTVMSQDISIIVMNAEKPLVSEDVAKKIACAIIQGYYGDDQFRPKEEIDVVDRNDVWELKIYNNNNSSALYDLGVRSIVMQIRKSDAAVLSFKR